MRRSSCLFRPVIVGSGAAAALVVCRRRRQPSATSSCCVGRSTVARRRHADRARVADQRRHRRRDGDVAEPAAHQRQDARHDLDVRVGSRRRLRRYEIVVQRDLAHLNEQMKRLFPGEAIEAPEQRQGDRAVRHGDEQGSRRQGDRRRRRLRGEEGGSRQPARRSARARASNQVLLRVRFAEVSRTRDDRTRRVALHRPERLQERRSARIDDAAAAGAGRSTAQRPRASKLTFSDFLNLFLFDAKHQLGVGDQGAADEGLFQSLAEPNLVAESGKEASFLAGGEFPVPVAQASGGNRRDHRQSSRNSASA